MAGIMDAWSDEFHKMGTFADDYYKNVITPYKEGLRQKPGFWQSMKNWQPWRAVMPKNWGGTYWTKPTPMASKFLGTAGRIAGGASMAGVATALTPSAGAGERELQWERENIGNKIERGQRMGSGANRGFTETDYGKAYQRGGSVNPFEETARAGREYQPTDRIIDSIPGQEGDKSFFKRGYEKAKPYVPKVRDDMLNWDVDTDYGKFGFGLGEGKFGFNWKMPLGSAHREGIASLTPSPPNYRDFYMDKIIRDNPEDVMYNLMRQYPSPEMQEYFDQPIDRYQLDFGGPEVDQWIEENPGSNIGDLFEYLPELRKTGLQPGDFWFGGATA